LIKITKAFSSVSRAALPSNIGPGVAVGVDVGVTAGVGVGVGVTVVTGNGAGAGVGVGAVGCTELELPVGTFEVWLLSEAVCTHPLKAKKQRQEQSFR
jgi:hypothetical protein